MLQSLRRAREPGRNRSGKVSQGWLEYYSKLRCIGCRYRFQNCWGRILMSRFTSCTPDQPFNRHVESHCNPFNFGTNLPKTLQFARTTDVSIPWSFLANQGREWVWFSTPVNCISFVAQSAALLLCGPSVGFVDLSVINGEAVVKDGKFTTIDLDALVKAHNACSARICSFLAPNWKSGNTK